MKKRLFLFLAMLTLAVAPIQADIIFSTSSVDPFAGTNLQLTNVGDSGSIFVFFSTEEGRVLQGVSFNIDSSDADTLEATAHLVQNPGSTRWNQTSPGALGDMVVDSRAAALFAPFGLGTMGHGDFVLYSELQFVATAFGNTGLSFSRGPLGLSYRGIQGDQWDTFTTGTAIVTVAIPEPTSAILLVGAGLGLVSIRRRK